FRLTKRTRHLRIGPRAPARDALELLPHPALESRGLEIKRKLAMRRPALDAHQDLLHPALEPVGSGGNFGARIFGAQFRDEPAFFTAKITRRDAALCGGNENLSERRLSDGVAELHAQSSLSIRRGRHAQLRVTPLVDAARPAGSGFVKRLRKCLSPAPQCF